MGIFNSTNKFGEHYLDVTFVDGIDDMPLKTPMRLTLKADGNLEISKRVFEKKPLLLNLSQITNAGMVNSQELIEHGKSVIGRAAVGGLLLGPLGAIVGGVSGTGTKKKTEYHNYFVINYSSHSNNEPKILSFENQPGNLPGTMQKFIDELREKCGFSESEVKQNSNIL